MENIEVEIRSFLSEEQFERLLDFFNKTTKPAKEDYQETFYFDSEDDLRIQRNNFFSKIWMKKGKIHDEFREEIEVKFPRDDFEKLEKIFLSLGFNMKIKWFRNRREFLWDGIKVCMDFTRGYGHIIELEKICSENEKEKTLETLKQKLLELNIPLTPREEFEKKFKFYEENWEKLTAV